MTAQKDMLVLSENISALIKNHEIKDAEKMLVDFEEDHGPDAFKEAIKELSTHDLAVISRDGDFTNPSIIQLYTTPKQFAQIIVQQYAYALQRELVKSDIYSFGFVMTGVLFREDLIDDPVEQMNYVSELAYGSKEGFDALVFYIKNTLSIPGMNSHEPSQYIQQWYDEHIDDYAIIDDHEACSLMHRIMTYEEKLGEDILNALNRLWLKELSEAENKASIEQRPTANKAIASEANKESMF